MQWDKVKTILLAILLVVDGFLAWNLSQNFISSYRRDRETLENVKALAEAEGVRLAPGFSLPAGGTLPALETERSIRAEEQTAAALLGEDARREDGEDGSALYAKENGESVRFFRDGGLQARLKIDQTPESSADCVRLAEQRLAGFPTHGGVFEAVGEDAVRLTAGIAGAPLFDRALEIRFADGWAEISGRWTLELPYTTTGASTYYDAADALLTYAYQSEKPAEVCEMTLGYRLGEENAGRIPLVVCWRIETADGVEYLDTSKMTILDGEISETSVWKPLCKMCILC